MTIKYDDLIKFINEGKNILIISKNTFSKSDVSKLFFNLYHLNSALISITGLLIRNDNLNLLVDGDAKTVKDVKQIHFTNIQNFHKWMVKHNSIVIELDEIKFKIETSKDIKMFEIDISELKLPYLRNMLISIDSMKALNTTNFDFDDFQKSEIIVFKIVTNDLPKSSNPLFSAPEYFNDIGIIKIEWMIINLKFKIISKHSYLVKNENIKNSVKYEAINKISDDHRNRNGINFEEIASKLNADLNLDSVVSTDILIFENLIAFNILILEYLRHFLDIRIFRDKLILNLKQFTFKTGFKSKDPRNVKECLELYKTRLGQK